MTRNSFVFYRSFYDAFKTLTDEDFGKCARAVIEYALEGQEPQPGSIGCLTLGLVRPLLDKNNKRYENGCKGGRPNGNQAETKEEPNGNQAETKEEPNPNLNDKCKMINDKWEKDIESFPPSSEKICAAEAPRSTERDDLPKSTREKRDGESLTEKCRPIVEYLNERTSSNYRPSTKATQAHISARLKEGYTIDDFKAVIDRKVNEWQGTDYERFLTPDTLFGTKFEKYLNAKPRSRAPEPKVEHLLDGIL